MSEPFRITSISAWVSVDPNDPADEGICGFLGPDGAWMPMVAADEARLESLRPMAHRIARVSGKVLRLVRFSVREDIEVIEP